jgi:very-short-patch-repair endonuclease
VAHRLAELPIGRVVRLTGADLETLAALAARASDAQVPAVVSYYPPAASSAADYVSAALREFETAAVELFPAWLPDATGIDRPGGAGVAAVRAIATSAAASSRHFGPFLADLGERALTGVRPSASRFSPEVRTAGLARVIATSFHRDCMALLIHLPEKLSNQSEEALIAGAQWLADRGGMGVWLTGQLVGADWLESVEISPSVQAPGYDDPAEHPAIAGRPHPRSSTEQALESALARHAWSVGRAWNQTYQSHLLVNPVRLDLLWSAERCIVEVDGPEHCDPQNFEADRRRDVLLQLDGYAVLRFTNARIRYDVETVVSQIAQFIQARRLGTLEGPRDG